MPINALARLKAIDVQKKHPKGKAVETSTASAYDSLKKLKSKYPESHKGAKAPYGSSGAYTGE